MIHPSGAQSRSKTSETSEVRLLVLTQTVDTNSDVLGFFHSWLEKLADKFEAVTVVCLYKGHHELPHNVKVLSLGKETGLPRVSYLLRFYKYLWQERANYEAVLVHMTPIYIPLGWPFWRLRKTRIVLWYNHTVGNSLARLAIRIADTVLYTSTFSFSSRFKKGRIMPAGISTAIFSRDEGVKKSARSILYLGRLSPTKKVERLIQAAKHLDQNNVDFTLTIVGSPVRPGDAEYEKMLKALAQELTRTGKAKFRPSVRNLDAPVVYNQNELVINLTPSGSLDKTILEAMACETLVLVSNRALEKVLPNEFLFEEDDPEDLARKIGLLLDLTGEQKKRSGRRFRQYVLEHHSLDRLMADMERLVRHQVQPPFQSNPATNPDR